MIGPYPEWFDRPKPPETLDGCTERIWALVSAGASVSAAMAEVCDPLTWDQIQELARRIGVRV